MSSDLDQLTLADLAEIVLALRDRLADLEEIVNAIQASEAERQTGIQAAGGESTVWQPCTDEEVIYYGAFKHTL